MPDQIPYSQVVPIQRAIVEAQNREQKELQKLAKYQPPIEMIKVKEVPKGKPKHQFTISGV